MAGRTVRRFIEELGYVVRTPAAVFGRDRLLAGLADEDWLPVAGRHGWVVFGRDHHILDRELELAAYLKAKVHMFLLPGEANLAEIIHLLSLNLAAICTAAVARQPGVYWLTRHGLIDHDRRKAARVRRRTRSK